jgi:HEAT repeats
MMRGILLPAFLLLAVQATGQVKVDVLSPRQEYLECEPITVTVRVTNIGPDPVGYDSCDGRVDLIVVGQQKTAPPNLWGCGGGVASGTGCGIDHPPMLPPGKTIDFLYLLRDYRLKPGEYVLRVSGKAGVRWHSTPSFLRADSAPMPAPKFHDGEPVPGELFEEKLILNIRQADPEELKTAFIPYVRDAASSDPPVSYPARDAISQAAPAFLEKTIFEFASSPDTVPFAVKGLSRIDTNESRSDLVNLFNSSADPRIRESIVEALAEMSSSDQMDFFTGLVLASGSEPNDKILQWAILAIGRHGGDSGVDFLGSLQTTQPSPWLRSVMATALSTSKSPRAIPILIEMYADPDSLVRNNICGSLMSLTHRTWCDGSGQTARLQSTWRDWWRKNGPSTKVYGPQECTAPSEAAPLNFSQSAGSPTS